MTEQRVRGLTMPGSGRWDATPRGFRRFERTRPVGPGAGVWEESAAALLRWEVKTRSGFAVSPPGEVLPGARPLILAGALGIRVREPVEVLDVVRSETRVGFAYRTLPGHPVRGEEAFILTRAWIGDDAPVSLTLRSLTRPSDRWGWALAFPALLVAQALVRRRYFRTLRG